MKLNSNLSKASSKSLNNLKSKSSGIIYKINESSVISTPKSSKRGTFNSEMNKYLYTISS